MASGMAGEEQIEWDGDAVTQLRQDLGMSQQELSERLGVRQQTVSDWETGLHKPTGASVRMLSMVREQAGSYTTGHRKRKRP